jgi:hypothetical protein
MLDTLFTLLLDDTVRIISGELDAALFDDSFSEGDWRWDCPLTRNPGPSASPGTVLLWR